jgi:8-oxo-dGTP diphosphatase
MTGTVRAAGTVLWRRSPADGDIADGGIADGGIEIALIHRPRYDDWSLPKGKLKRGEDFAAAALRETREETGLDCVLGDPLPATYYWIDGRPKEVRYWAARAAASTAAFAPNREVDRLAWLPPSLAHPRLTHPRDRPLITALLLALA